MASNGLPKRKVGLWTFMVFVLLGLVVRQLPLKTRSSIAELNTDQPLTNFSRHEPLKQCVSPLPPSARPPAPLNIWAPLTVSELAQIHAWLESSERNLNLTRGLTTMSDNTVFLIETYPPPKADAVAYLSSPSSVPPPARQARVTIHHGSESAVRDYLVGPLPVGPNTGIRNLTDIYHRDEIPYNAKGINSIDEIRYVFSELTSPLADAMLVTYPT